MNEVDDLQSFITDCEWKTRKILRESNKRMKDNAKSFAAKERVEKLKHNKPNPKTKTFSSPLAKSKSINLSSSVQKSRPSITKKTITPVKDWKGRDKIIHDACETIKSLPVDKDKQSLKATIRKENLETEGRPVHSSLSASPFQVAKGTPSGTAPRKAMQHRAKVSAKLNADNDNPGSGEPEMITRRTIERDFYIMSKKHNSTRSKRRQKSAKQSESTPELKSSVLRKKYRCGERVMKAKKRRAERAHKKLKRLKMPKDEIDEAWEAGFGEATGSDSFSSSGEDDDGEEEYIHAMQDLLERHVEDENIRSLKRSNKMLTSTIFKPNVKEFWAHLQHNNGDDTTESGQVPSVPLHIATKVFRDSSLRVKVPNGGSDLPLVQARGPISRYVSPYKKHDDKLDAPLSMRITGCSPYTNTICPGHASIGERGVWRLADPISEEKTESMFPIWPSLTNLKFPEALDKSQASAYFHYKSLGPQKGNCVSVLSSLAFESPVLAPYCFAINKGYVSPPFAEHESLSGTVPYVNLPCTSLMKNAVQSRLDSLLPLPILVLDPGASEEDWENAPRDADGQVYHYREDNELDDDGFRVKTFASKVEYDDTIATMIYGISEKAASPNQPTTTPFLTHKSIEACTQDLIRERTAVDYHYIAESDGKGTLNEPYLFTTHMSAYSSVFVSRKSISSYREQERFLHATKEAERKRLELALKMKAAEELVEQRLKERIARIEKAVVSQEDSASVNEASVAIELPPSAKDTDSSLTPIERIPCDVELLRPPTDVEDIAESGELDQLANLLLKNTNFLKAMARKLSIPEEQVVQIESSTDNMRLPQTNNSSTTGSIDDENGESPLELSSKISLHKPLLDSLSSNVTLEVNNMPKLKLNCKRYRDLDHVSCRGDGWKRLPRSETIIGDFSLTKRNVEKGIGGPKFKKIEDNRNFIAVNNVQEALPYKPDPQQFAVEPKSIFISDLTTERLRLGKEYRQQKKAKESMLSMSQQLALDEILQIPVSKTASEKHEAPGENEADNDANVDQNNDDDNQVLEEEKVTPPIDHISRAILAVKNHNLPDLEHVLDAEGISVETRDPHGNTLFILACQQGSKKLAKFLLRRGANRNAQNNGGNTALHYLYEYKHISLAEYLIRKGADDSIKNGEGLTPYEGVTLT